MLETELNPKSDKWFSNVEEPKIVSDASLIAWDDEADLVIVGLGGAGIATALESLEQGLSVIGLDKTSGGGATARSGGVFYAGGGTSIQKEAGIEDSIDNMYNYLQQEVGDVVSEATLRKFCEDSPKNTQWLIDNGVKFNSTYFPKKTSYPDAGHFLYHSDNSLVPSYMEKALPAPRGHRGYEEGPFKPIGVGGTIFYPLKKAAQLKGLKTYQQTEVKALVIDTNNAVLGVKCTMLPSGPIREKYKKLISRGEVLQMILPPTYPGASLLRACGSFYINKANKISKKHQDIKFLRAKRGVCISAGGFVFNRAMIDFYAPKYSKGMPLGTSCDDGSGIRLGQSVGAKTALMNRVTAWRFLNPPHSFAKGIVVNAQGKRFTNEMVYGATLGDAMCENHGGKAYLILSEELFRSAKKEASTALPFQRDAARMMLYFGSKKSKDLKAISAKYNINEEGLASSIQKYNECFKTKRPCEFGKAYQDMALLEGSLIAIDISIDAKIAPLPTLTLGGLVVDENTGAVLGTNNKSIKGLYAAGRSAVGICSNIYVSGLSVADCIFSGRRIGYELGKHNE
ncbi:MAG: FAD-binding protein [Gammaproteobacteria bacterium]